jgi:LmeA-like phospholipid-binding
MRRAGCWTKGLIVLIALIVLLVAADFIAKAVAQGEVASQIQKQGFPKKPSVSIEGFPFLTQVASRDFQQIKLSSSDIPEGPVRISRVSATMTGIHLTGGFTKGVIDQLNGSILITFGSLGKTLNSQIGPLGSLVGDSGLKLSAAGSDEIKASLDLLVASGSATWKITRPNGQEVQAQLVSSDGVPGDLLDSLRSFTVKIPKLPYNVKIESVHITPEGIVGRISGHDLPFGS